ncbi:uncharacterized protein K444DRAFT_632800 [Hyaloscypha bicolor E]|uniref:Uncharacterized protein n=1 Tax=Hyaloscypha bicolor E TaxID=1095630 RepID=A0A2J6T025_9HELO|nr:uncharacterized protein K444DRAFT_632800 [Hyaloscypha bicolor E]PMD56386.1 hypothetical protein K444DRAFT_632800 [Hyaloscypha bicolor E]
MTLLVPIAVREIRIKTGPILIRVDAMPFLPLSHAVSYCMSLRAHVESDVPKMECNLANYPDAEVRTIIAAVVRARPGRVVFVRRGHQLPRSSPESPLQAAATSRTSLTVAEAAPGGHERANGRPLSHRHIYQMPHLLMIVTETPPKDTLHFTPARAGEQLRDR